jgi:TRAP-type C4-dicarboxylate transport system substrate-binding protein
MTHRIDRRALIVGGAAAAAASGFAGQAFAQAKPNLRFSAVFSEQDIRAEMMKRFGEAIKEDFTLQPYYGGNLFKQGTELVAMQRNNLEMGNIAPQDVSNQIPAWSILTSGYLLRDADHLKKVFASDVGAELKKMAEEKLNIRILGPTYFGARHVGLKPKKKIATPADMAGVKLRMPGGDAWQFLGQSLGANPTPMAYAEVYTGLQSGAIDGQDNPLPNVQNMKFYEVSSQIVLTSHLVGFDLLCVTDRVWKAMSAEKQKAFQAAADAAIDWSTKEHVSKEAELVDFFKKQGLEVYAPDVAAFRDFAQKKYLASDLAKSWPAGMVAKINAL